MLRWAGKSGSMLGHSLRGEKNEKTICCFCSGMSDSWSDGGAGLSADGQKLRGRSPAAKAQFALWPMGENDNRGLLEPAREGAQDFWRIGPLTGKVWARGRQ